MHFFYSSTLLLLYTLGMIVILQVQNSCGVMGEQRSQFNLMSILINYVRVKFLFYIIKKKKKH